MWFVGVAEESLGVYLKSNSGKLKYDFLQNSGMFEHVPSHKPLWPTAFL